MSTDWRSRVLQHVDDHVPEMLAALVDLVRIPTVTGTAVENEGQAVMARQLTADGFDIDHWQIDLDAIQADVDFPGVEVPRDEAWGLVARLPGRGGGRSLMLNGHIDVVPPGDPAAWSTVDPYSGTVDSGHLYGRGSCDMKAGLVAARWAMRSLREVGVPLRGDLLLASVQGEEDGGLGTFSTLRRGWRADACVIPEPTGLDLVPANGGALTFRLHVHGQATHASRRTDGVSALEKLWPVWRALSALEDRRNREVDPLASRWEIAYPLSIGTVRCGDWPSSVPDLLVAEGRLGVALGEPMEHARQELEQAVAEACDADDWLRAHPVDVEWWGGQFASGRLPEDSDLLELVSSAHAEASGAGRPDVWAAPYGSDLRLLVGIGGIPTLQYGPGDAARAHGPDESVSLAETVTAARALAVLALDICGVA
ncbi:MAG: ArgE/DapE family deacylase [Acidimicrobiia bacterium]